MCPGQAVRIGVVCKLLAGDVVQPYGCYNLEAATPTLTFSQVIDLQKAQSQYH